MDLDVGYQQLLISDTKDSKSDIICFLVKEHNTPYVV